MYLFVVLVLLIFTPTLGIDPLSVHSASTSPTKVHSILNFLTTDIVKDYNYLKLNKTDINLNSLNSLNLKDIKSVRIHDDSIVIPNNFKPVFLFDEFKNYKSDLSAAESSIFRNGRFSNFTEFLQKSPPFNIPKLNFYDLSLLIPKKVEALKTNIPFLRDMVPLLVFHCKNESNQDESSKVIGLSDDITSNNVVEFDELTSNWFKDLSINKLIEGYFCNLNDETCVAIDLKDSKISIFSIWEDKSLNLPLTILLNNDGGPRSKSYQQIMQEKKVSLRNSHLKKRKQSNSLDDLKYNLEQRLKQKKLKKDRKINIKSKLSSKDPTLSKQNENLYKSTINTGKKISKSYPFNSFNKEKQAVNDYKLDKTQKTIDKIKLVSTRLDKKVKDEEFQKEKELKEDCEPITWFNVFHHSIFSNVKFCV